MVVFAPWAFGTTQGWSMRVMNVGGYLLGTLLAVKWILRGRTGNPLPRPAPGVVAKALAVVTVAILGWCLVSALNAQFDYLSGEFRADPRPHVKWLPHSLDRNATWTVFWNWLALAGVFWAARDWLVTDVEADGRRRARRLRRLIFVLVINGALVALEGIFQRLSGTPKLLWFQATHDNPFADAQFGPYAYRSNAAQFFNLLWPPALGLWWHLHLRAAEGSRRSERHHWMLPCVVLLVVAPLVTLSRGGFAVAAVQAVACAVLLFVAARFSFRVRLGVGGLLVVAVGLALLLAGDKVAKRFEDSAADPLRGRSETYLLAERMTKDYPWLGIGPGAYSTVFQIYRNSPDDYWPKQLHNDWLEYRITFGRIGGALLLAAGALVFARWFVGGGLRIHWTFAGGIWIAIAGCLLHARFDFPFQIYSIQFVFVLLCAALFSISRGRGM